MGGDVSSGKAAASGRVEVMRKRIAREEVRLGGVIARPSRGPIARGQRPTVLELIPSADPC